MRTSRTGTLAALVAALAIAAIALPTTAAVPQFQDGDRVCIVGDSISHGRRYHLYLHAFYVTRFPERRIDFINCGISGDTAAGAIRRFQWDIAPHRPTVSTILLGMNDVGVTLYGEGKTEEQYGERRKQRIEAYGENMAQLVGMLRDADSAVIALTPTIYDDTVDVEGVNYKGSNAALAQCAERVRTLAKDRDIALVEVYEPMNALNRRIQNDDPKATVVGPDRIHPLDPGQFFIAWRILEAQDVPGIVSSLTVDAAAGKATECENATLLDLAASPQSLSFRLLEKALPYPMAPKAQPAMEWVPFQEEMNRQMVRIVGLDPGDYDLTIDGKSVLRADAADWARGVDLAANEKTPMLAQARKVYDILEKRFSQQVRIRNVAKVRHNILKDLDNPLDTEAAKPALDAYLERYKGKSNENYYQGMINSYLAYAPKLGEIQETIDALTQQAYEANRPKPHVYELRPASGKAPPQASDDPAVLTDFVSDSDWNDVGITNVEAKVSFADGIAEVEMPQRQGQRDLWSVWLPVKSDISNYKTVHFRLRAPKGKKTTLRVHDGAKLHSTISYIEGTGDWQDLSGDLPDKAARRIYVILGEPSDSEPHDAETALYELDKIWFE